MPSISINNGLFLAVACFVLVFLVMFFHHEHGTSLHPTDPKNAKFKLVPSNISPPKEITKNALRRPGNNGNNGYNLGMLKFKPTVGAVEKEIGVGDSLETIKHAPEDKHSDDSKKEPPTSPVRYVKENVADESLHIASRPLRHGARRGTLICNGERVDSEIIYWQNVPGDDVYESPITPHHGIHHDRYLTFEYDQGGWNNVRMSLESLIVVAHAMGRTLVVPPQQHLYLLGETHKDPHDKKPHDEMGFEDFFDIELLRSHKGFHVIHMEEFLAKEGVTGGLHGELELVALRRIVLN